MWWRRWHDDSDEELDNTHLMRLAGRFSRRVRAWAGANGVPVIECKRGERKHRIVEEYLASHTVAGPAVFLPAWDADFYSSLPWRPQQRQLMGPLRHDDREPSASSS